MAIRDTQAQDIRVESADLNRRHRLRRIALIGAVICACLLAVWLAYNWLQGGRSVDTARLRIAEVKRGDLVRDIAAEGKVIASNSPSLYAIAPGTVTLHVVAGDVVKAGDLLAEIDSPELRSRLAQEQATLASMQADVRRAGLNIALARSNAGKLLDQARVDQIAAQRELERYQRAFEGGAIAKVDVTRAEDTVKKVSIGVSHAREDARLQNASASLDATNRESVAMRQRAVVEELQRQVDALALRAPFAGQVGQVFVQQHANAAGNAPVLSLVDLSQFEVEIKVPESFARDLAIGMPAQLTGNNQTYDATVSAVSPEVVGGEVSARLRFAQGQQPPALRQSQRLSARILLDTRKNVLKVERGPALEQNSAYAWVVRDGIATHRPVSLGAASLDSVEIKHGLNAGEQVIVSGAEDFKPDERVRIH